MTASALREIFVLANAFKEGDLLIGGTADDRLRDEARRALMATTVADIRRTVFVDDGVSASLRQSRDRRFDGELDPLSIAQLKTVLLGAAAPAWVRAHRDALASEAIAAVVKVMTTDELSSVARRLFNPLEGPDVVIGAPRHFGSRIHPNNPGDD